MNFIEKIKLILKDLLKNNKFEFTILFIFIIMFFLFGHNNSVRASSSYTQVEYITISKGIATDVVPTDKTRVVLDFKDDSVGYYQNLISASLRTDISKADTKFLIQRNDVYDTFNFYWGRSGGEGRSPHISKGVRYLVDFNRNNVYFNNELFVYFSNSSWTTDNSLILALNCGNSSDKFTIYSLKIYENDELIRDYIPVLNNTTNEYGLLDKITNSFISAGSSSIGGGIVEDTVLNLSVYPTDTTDNFVSIYTQNFSEEFRNTHKCYVSYNNEWYLSDVSTDGYYYIHAIENGVYKFKLEDLQGNVLSSATMTITNIVRDTEKPVLSPILNVSKTSSGLVRVNTQSFSLTGIARYECYYWLSSNSGTFDTKIKLGPTITNTNNGRLIYFMKEFSSDDTVYFVFFDKTLQKYSEVVSLTVDVSYVLENDIYDIEVTEKTLSSLLKQKFGVFYSSLDFLKEFWNTLTSDNISPPDFTFTFPDFLGGGTYSIFNIEIFDKYRTYVHYVLAGFIYYYYIKRMTKVIPNLISDIAN